AVHLLVVALPEEFFYRGWLYARLCEGLDEKGRGRRMLGVVIGPAFWLTAVLFAAGHLTEPYFWRLAVFFPALLFAWLRLRTGGLLAPIVFHALSNVWVVILEASFFTP
ncbi:MAG: myxosortase family intramembrane protease, partial [Myxococcota bacterium]